MKAKLVEWVRPGANGARYYDGDPGAFTTAICEDVEFTSCGLLLRKVRETGRGRPPEIGPNYPSMLIPAPSSSMIVITDVEIRE